MSQTIDVCLDWIPRGAKQITTLRYNYNYSLQLSIRNHNCAILIAMSAVSRWSIYSLLELFHCYPRPQGHDREPGTHCMRMR